LRLVIRGGFRSMCVERWESFVSHVQYSSVAEAFKTLSSHVWDMKQSGCGRVSPFWSV
jgi:hypothetical protein